MKLSTLTTKQDLFCREFIIDLNASKAAIRAGYSKKTAKEIGSQNLTKLNIQERITQLRKKTLDSLDITHQRIAEEYAKIAFSDISNFLNNDNRIKDIKEIPNTSTISSLTIDERIIAKGKNHKNKNYSLE